MDHDNKTKKRLNELKKMSIELKESINEQGKIDYNLIEDIIFLSKQSSFQRHNQNQQIDQNIQNEENSKYSSKKSKILTPLFKISQQNEKKKSKKQGSDYFYKTAINDTMKSTLNKSKTSSKKSFFQPLNNLHHEINEMRDEQQQIDALRQENQLLQCEITKLMKQVTDLKKEETVIEDESWKYNLPFNSFQNVVNVFMTKLQIKESDYDKIDYQRYEMKIQFDKIYSKKQNKSIGRVIEILELKEVHYIDELKILLFFVNEKEETFSLFMKFDNEDSCNQWDFTIFINLTIMKTIKSDKQRFINQPIESNRKLSENSIDKSPASRKLSQDFKIDQKQLMKILVERRQLYMEAKRLANSKLIQKKQKSKISNQSFSSDRKFSIKQDDNISIIHQNLHDSNLSNDSNKIKDLNVFSEPLRLSQQKESRANTSKFNNAVQTPPSTNQPLQFWNSFMEKTKTNIQKEDQKTKEADLKAKEKEKEEEEKKKKYEDAVKSLVSGIYLTKYSKDGFKPHNKKVFLSPSDYKLVWHQSNDEKDSKSIDISSIISVTYKKIGQGIKKHLKQPIAVNHVVIDYTTQDSKKKTMQFGSSNPQLVRRFSQNLQIYIHRQRGT